LTGLSKRDVPVPVTQYQEKCEVRRSKSGRAGSRGRPPHQNHLLHFVRVRWPCRHDTGYLSVPVDIRPKDTLTFQIMRPCRPWSKAALTAHRDRSLSQLHRTMKVAIILGLFATSEGFAPLLQHAVSPRVAGDVALSVAKMDEPYSKRKVALKVRRSRQRVLSAFGDISLSCSSSRN
jgi:hypothetical protein